MKDYAALITRHVLDADTFVKATFSGRRHGHQVPWKKVTVRPVLIQDRRHLQFTTFDGQQAITKNYRGAEAEARLQELLDLPFRTMYVQTTEEGIQVEISKRGKVFVRRHDTPARRPTLRHDRRKARLLSPKTAAPFLQAIGILTEDGRVRADMRHKYQQIDHFLRLIVETGALEGLTPPLSIVDCGCGSAHLTFAVYYYLNHRLELPTRMVGVDTNADLLRRRAALAEHFEGPELTFTASRIIDFTPPAPPDIVLALHACDTATDEALAQAVRWQSRMIFSAPCCHHHLQAQMSAEAAPAPFGPVLRHGILRERLGDVLTDSLRAALLEVMGYRTDVVEFVAVEHTPKNLLIRALRADGSEGPAAYRSYTALRDFWGVTPYLETLLKADLPD